jgi:hypothetical protein
MLDKYKILQQTVSILPWELGVSSISNVSSVSENSTSVHPSAKKKQRVDVAGESQDHESLHQTLRVLASGFSSSKATSDKAVATEVLQKAEDTYIRYVQLVHDATSAGLKAIYEDRLAKAKIRLEKAESFYEQANSM